MRQKKIRIDGWIVAMLLGCSVFFLCFYFFSDKRRQTKYNTESEFAAAYLPTVTSTFETIPTDTPMPEPIPTDTSTPESTPTDTTTPEPTLTDTPTPEPTPTDTPTPEPTPTDMPAPEPTLTDTPTPEPTPTDTPTPEPTPTDMPAPEPTSIEMLSEIYESNQDMDIDFRDKIDIHDVIFSDADVERGSQAGFSAQEFLEAVKSVYIMAYEGHYSYGNSSTLPPCIDGLISSDRLIARALWELGMTDQEFGGETVHTLPMYLESHGFYRINNMDELLPGDIVFIGKVDGTEDYNYPFVIVPYDPITEICCKYDFYLTTVEGKSKLEIEQPFYELLNPYPQKNILLVHIELKLLDRCFLGR